MMWENEISISYVSRHVQMLSEDALRPHLRSASRASLMATMVAGRRVSECGSTGIASNPEQHALNSNSFLKKSSGKADCTLPLLKLQVRKWGFLIAFVESAPSLRPSLSGHGSLRDRDVPVTSWRSLDSRRVNVRDVARSGSELELVDEIANWQIVVQI